MSLNGSFFSLVAFVTSASGDVADYGLDPSGCSQRSGCLQLILHISFKSFPLKAVAAKLTCLEEIYEDKFVLSAR
jgi:hypothetical protein